MTTTGLPEPTDDLDQQRADLATHGYCLVADALRGDIRARVQHRLEEQAAAEMAAGLAIMDGPNQTIGNLIDKGEEFWWLVEHPVIDDLIGWLLGPDTIVSSSLGKLVSSGGEPGFIHNDQGYVDLTFTGPLVANVMWMVSAFSAANGGTHLVPGSHLVPRQHGDPVADDAWVPAEGPPGTAMVFDGRLTHRTGVNAGSDRRLGVLTYWCRPWVRQQENMVASLRPETVAAMPDSVKRRVGFAPFRSLGGLDLSPNMPEITDPSAPRTGRLS